MKTLTFLSLSAATLGLVSCNNQTSNPYGAPAAQAPTSNPYAVPQSNGETNAPYQQLPGVGNTLPPTQPAAPNSYQPPAAPTPDVPAAGSTLPHTVKPGDSLWKLSRDYDTTVEAIRAANGISGNNIRVGETIQIPNN
jgi:LysM repeat protein